MAETSGHEELRQRLLASREALQRRLSALEGDSRRGLDRDSQEQATELENRDVEIALSNEARVELAHIDTALKRFEAGVYGTCARCGEDIAPARLDAYPAATLCVDCVED